jgi:benzil reductase ((S)-benzoin forming)
MLCSTVDGESTVANITRGPVCQAVTATVSSVRSVIITGVSRGLGAALFDEFHAAGDCVLALGRRFTEGQHAAERADAHRIRLRPAELAYPSSLPSAAELASFVHDATDVVLVHNAAVLAPVNAIGTLHPEELQLTVTVNLTAPMLLTNALLGAGILRPTGAAVGAAGRDLTVLFVSSEAARRLIGGWPVYGATKRGGESFFETLAAQHADDPRVRVLSIDPGVVDTDMQAQLRDYATREVYFPERERFIALQERDELAPPAQAARQILATYLSPEQLTRQ